jgi:hypothetical protein
MSWKLDIFKHKLTTARTFKDHGLGAPYWCFPSPIPTVDGSSGAARFGATGGFGFCPAVTTCCEGPTLPLLSGYVRGCSTLNIQYGTTSFACILS